MTDLRGKKVLINAGPTHEKIDPVRYIGNYSSGRMGIAIAKAAMEAGADVHLVLGPVSISDLPGCTTTRVTSAADMYDACMRLADWFDIAILSAAVADFTPADPLSDKLKRGKESLILKLKPTMDIAAALGSVKKEDQLIAGFALETSNVVENAMGKLKRKNLDIIVLNSPSDEGTGFGYDTNRITIIDKYNIIDKFELKPKDEVARDILG